MPEINLLKNELREGPGLGFKVNRSRVFMILAAILALEILAFFTFFILTKVFDRKILGAEREAAAVEAEIATLEPNLDSAVSFQRRLTTIGALLDNHARWTAVLAELEKYTYKPAVFNTLQVDEKDQKFVVTGTVPTYTDLAKLMVGLKQSRSIKSVELKSSALDESGAGGLSFNIEIKFDSKLLVTYE